MNLKFHLCPFSWLRNVFCFNLWMWTFSKLHNLAFYNCIWRKKLFFYGLEFMLFKSTLASGGLQHHWQYFSVMRLSIHSAGGYVSECYISNKTIPLSITWCFLVTQWISTVNDYVGDFSFVVVFVYQPCKYKEYRCGKIYVWSRIICVHIVSFYQML